MSRQRGRGAALLTGVLLGAACAPPDEGARASDPQRPWVIATTVDLSGVNELVSSGVRFSHEVQELLFSGLLTEQPDYAERPPSFAPALAESWQVSDDGLEAVFRLRAEARWSDGRPITADDVVFSHRAQISDEVAWAYAESKDGIEEVVAVDPRTVRVRFRTSYPHRLVDLNDGFVLPSHAWGGLPLADWRRAGDWFREHLVTSGPYRLASWQPGVELILERNPRHWAPVFEGAPPGVVFRVVPDPAALVEQLLAGAFDFFDGLSPLDAERVAAAPHLRLITSEARQFDYIGWNLRRPPFDDPRVRLALTLAIDRQTLVDALLHGRATVSSGPVPTGFWAHDRELEPWPYDPQAARDLLVEAGFDDLDGDGVIERDGRPLRIEISTNAGNRTRADALVLIQEQLARVGVAVEPRLLEIHALTERNRAGEFDATLSGWAVDTTLDLRPYFHSREIRQDGWNWVAFADDELDRLLDETRRLPDLEATRPLFARIQRILHEQQPYTFLWEPQRFAAVRTGIDGVEPNPLSAHGSLPRWRRVPAPVDRQ